MERPNILLITTDQQHFSTLGTVNEKIQTPNLDRLSRMGTRFDRGYCAMVFKQSRIVGEDVLRRFLIREGERVI